MSNKNTGLIAAILFASITISGSLVFFATQLKSNSNSPALAANVQGSDELQKKIDQGVENYIQKKVQAQQAQAGQPNEEKVGTVKAVSTDDHVLGNKDAPISLIEYSDFECPFCKLFHPTSKQVVDSYGGKVNLVYRHFPLDFHKNAEKEAEASECANELGGNEKFWAYTDKIFERTTSNGTGFALNTLVPLAKEIGLDETKFKNCLDSGKYEKHVQQDIAEGSAAGVTGTPGNIIYNNKSKEAVLISGAQSFEVFKTAIDAMLNSQK